MPEVPGGEPMGIDPNYARIYAEKFQFKSLRFIYNELGIYIPENDSWTGNYGMVDREEATIVMGTGG